MDACKNTKVEIDSNQDSCCTQLQGMRTSEHDSIQSRTTGRMHEIMFGPQPGNLVPRNPFASAAQRGYLNSHPEVLGRKALDEWNASSKGQKVPYKVKKAK
jgi:hypothetical protein